MAGQLKPRGITSLSPDTGSTIVAVNGKIEVHLTLAAPGAASNTAARVKLFVPGAGSFNQIPPAVASQPDAGGTTTAFNWTGAFNKPTAAMLPGTNKLAIWSQVVSGEWELHVVTIIVSM